MAAEAAALGGEAIAVKADVSKREELEALVKATTDKWGTVDVLVNNAGITRDGLMMRMKPGAFCFFAPAVGALSLSLCSAAVFRRLFFFPHTLSNPQSLTYPLAFSTNHPPYDKTTTTKPKPKQRPGTR